MKFAPAAVECRRRDDGAIVLESPLPLGAHPPSVTARLREWAERAPERVFLAERTADGGWRAVTYGDAWHAALALTGGLVRLGLHPKRPLAILSGNSIDHALVTLAAMLAGIPVAPISPAYSLMSQDFGKLRAILAQLEPGALFAAPRAPFARAIAGAAPSLPVIDDLAALRGPDTLVADFGPDSVAKILFTSGSTGAPKGVVNTQRMLTSNQQMIAQLWPFLAARPPVTVDWLPWSHTFGANHNFNMILWHGGTLYLDGGKPTPEGIATTIANLRDVSPTIYFNVPRGFDMLLPALERDAELRARFFAEIDLVFYAAAALPDALWRRLEAVSLLARGEKATMVSAWGSTETSPLVTQVHFPIDRAGVIGLPAPGVSLKLAPVGDRLELRVRGPNVTPGYWSPGGVVQPPALDDEGYLPMGDAGKLFDEREPARGVVFDGRLAENFKLSSGTWVAVGALRVGCIAACDPLVADAVVTGHDRDYVALILFCGKPVDDAGRARIRAALAARNRDGGSSAQVRRVVITDEPPSIDAGEITDKGYLNQRAILDRRAALVERLYAEPPAFDVLTID
jgi:feruloyl-CoA synthase